MFFGAQTCDLEFRGGPLDGHQETIRRSSKQLADLLAIPINANLLSTLDGRGGGPKMPATSVAVYELRIAKGIARYQFIGPTSVAEFRLEQWTG